MNTNKHLSWRWLWVILLGLLLWWALRNVPLQAIANALANLKWWQIAILLGINALIFSFITARWWLIVRADNRRIPFLPLLGYRLSVFGLSYFTPGPQVGGEPLQIIYLKNRYGMTTVRATAAVIMDKLLEFLANFIFLVFGFWSVVYTGLLPRFEQQTWVTLMPLIALLLWPAIHIALLAQRRYPVSQALRWLRSLTKKQAKFQQAVRLIVVAERLASRFIQRHPGRLLGALGVSLLWWLGMLLEFSLMLHFLGVHWSLFQATAALTAMLLAFLIPVPAGLGALEASQVFVFTSFGATPAAAISLSLLIRGRDILLGGLGLLLAGRTTKLTQKHG